jgi:hypothetical protein
LEKAMLNRDTEKTIPYRLSAAELASLRILRSKTNPYNSCQDAGDDEGPEKTGEIKSRNSDPSPWLASLKVKKNRP